VCECVGGGGGGGVSSTLAATINEYNILAVKYNICYDNEGQIKLMLT
jgi:hypothetical protein